MNRTIKILLAVTAIPIGYRLNYLAWTTHMEPPWNSLALLFGVVLMLGGIGYLIFLLFPK